MWKISNCIKELYFGAFHTTINQSRKRNNHSNNLQSNENMDESEIFNTQYTAYSKPQLLTWP